MDETDKREGNAEDDGGDRAFGEDEGECAHGVAHIVIFVMRRA
jgi:hypothetical protein